MENVFLGCCTCNQIQYQLTSPPLIVHACHCSWCQRQTGSAFVVNALIEVDRVVLLAGEPVTVKVPSPSGRGQRIVRCPHCYTALWSFYGYKNIAFVRVGTLDTPEKMPPDIHIYTSTKQSWVLLPEGALQKQGYYSINRVWSAESLARVEAMKAKT